VRMKSRTYLAVLVAVMAVAVACEREERQPGGRSQQSSGLAQVGDKNVVTVSYSALPSTSNVAEVAPKSGAGGPDGAEIYSRTCAACHQANGQGVPGAFPPLDGSPYVNSPNVERMAAIMLYGLMGPITVHGTTYNGVMLPQGGVLKDDELAAVASYVRSSWSNKSSPFEPSVFAKMREKYGQRAQFTIQELGAEP